MNPAATPAPTVSAPPTAIDSPPTPAPALAAGPALRAGYTRRAGRTLVSASATGLGSGVHAFHLHAGCDGRPAFHLTTLAPLFADASGGAATTTAPPASLMVAGEGVIVDPGPDPVHPGALRAPLTQPE